MGLVMLRGGDVVDGAPVAEPWAADLLIAGDRILEVAPAGTLPVPTGAETVDCSGHVVAPGFIDLHTHSDLTRLVYPDAESRVRQGVTTEVIGNCGLSPAPVGSHGAASLRETIGPVDLRPDLDFSWEGFPEYLDLLEASPSAVNTVALVGHGSARHAIMGNGPQPATAGERDAIVDAVAEALAAGAWGVSFGLMYSPGENADREELQAVARAASRRGALAAAHVRAYEGPALLDAVGELLTFAGDGPVQVSHLRSIGAGRTGVVARALGQLHEHRERGVDVAADAYPYLAGHTTALQLLPEELRRAGPTAAVAAIRHDREAIAAQLQGLSFPPEAITIARAGDAGAGVVGRTVADLGGDGVDWRHVLLELLDRHDGSVDVIVVGADPDDVELTLRDPLVSIASDGAALAYSHDSTTPHPRSFGTFPRAIRMLLDAGMPIGEAIAKATSMPADRLGLTDRGRLAAGTVGDIAVIAPEVLADRATYAHPATAPAGVRDVFVSGVAVVRDGAPTGARPGGLLRRGG